MMCAGLTEDEIAAANADEEFKQYMNGDTGKGDSGKFSYTEKWLFIDA